MTAKSDRKRDEKKKINWIAPTNQAVNDNDATLPTMIGFHLESIQVMKRTLDTK